MQDIGSVVLTMLFASSGPMETNKSLKLLAISTVVFPLTWKLIFFFELTASFPIIIYIYIYQFIDSELINVATSSQGASCTSSTAFNDSNVCGSVMDDLDTTQFIWGEFAYLKIHTDLLG